MALRIAFYLKYNLSTKLVAFGKTGCHLPLRQTQTTGDRNRCIYYLLLKKHPKKVLYSFTLTGSKVGQKDYLYLAEGKNQFTIGTFFLPRWSSISFRPVQELIDLLHQQHMIRYLAVLNPLYATLFWAIVLTIGTFRINRAKFMLGIFMMVAFFLYLGHAFYFTRNFWVFTWYEWVYTLTSLSVFPMYYHYIRLLTVEPKLRFSDLVHYLPAITIAFSSLLLIIFMGTSNRTVYIHHLEKGSHSFYFSENFWIDAYQTFFLLSRLIFGIQVFAYLVLNVRLIRLHREILPSIIPTPKH